MPSYVRSRFDQRGGIVRPFLALWALELPGWHPQWREYLIALYKLVPTPGAPAPVKHKDDVTHEFILCALDPATPVQYGKSLMKQPKLSPLTPPEFGFQLMAKSNEDAVEQVGAFVDALKTRAVAPGNWDAFPWQDLFPGGIMVPATGS